MDQLPPDVVYRIADRLPFKCLVRCRCARKEWYTDPFLKTCMAKFIERPAIVALDVQSRRRDPDKKPRFKVDKERNFVSASVPLMDRPEGRISVGSCNGLICFEDAPGSLVLVNPLLEEFLSISLPPPEGSLANSSLQIAKALLLRRQLNYILRDYGWNPAGLGFGHARDVYKLVTFSGGEMLVFELCTSSWRKISMPERITPSGKGVFLDGALYWLQPPHNILSFDVAKEDCALQWCPNVGLSTLFELGGHLGAARFSEPPGDIDIWELNLHSKEWTYKYNINAPVKDWEWVELRPFRRFDILGTQNEMILFRIANTMYSYDPRGRKLECIHTEGNATEFYCLQGSLVSLSRFNRHEL